MIRILITGQGSYIGTHFMNYLKENFPAQYEVDELDMMGDGWKSYDFTKYDVVYHVAGIVHLKEKKENEQLYYQVNRDLTYEVAKKAKAAGVKQFIFMSTMSVYGLIYSEEPITKNTPCRPVTYYGKSKLEAEKLISKLEDTTFKVCIMRPPMIYGKGAKGNYPLLAKFAKKTPIFPTLNNERSMLYVGNLVEFIRLMIENNESGVFLPQNEEYVSSKKLVKMVSSISGHIDKSLSQYKQKYCLYSFEESIRLTENK